MKTQQEDVKVVHPLLEKKVDCIVNWTEWKQLWGAESRADILHSLLHVGFEVSAGSDENAIDRILLYLEIANGCFDYHTFEESGGPDHGRPFYSNLVRFGKKIEGSQGLRRMLSQKAFQVLCQRLFKNTFEEQHRVPSWVWYISAPQIFSKLLWFFRLDRDGRIFNLGGLIGPRDISVNNGEIAKQFVQEFCLFAWDCEKEIFYDQLSDETKNMFRQSRPSMIEILSGLGKLDLLFRDERYRTIDEECEKKLEYLALAFDFYLPSPKDGKFHRKPETLEEACYARSQAAQVLILLRVMRKQDALFKKKHELKAQLRDAENQLQELASP